MIPVGHGLLPRMSFREGQCYIAKFGEAVYVLHAFEKRSRATPLADVELARARFNELLARRASKKRHK